MNTSADSRNAPPLAEILLGRMHDYRQAANYLSVGQIHLCDIIRCSKSRSNWPTSSRACSATGELHAGSTSSTCTSTG
ncbi:MAG: hypothetical protein WBO95_02335 [Candidatus Dechloromonas phosphoritropha]